MLGTVIHCDTTRKPVYHANARSRLSPENRGKIAAGERGRENSADAAKLAGLDDRAGHDGDRFLRAVSRRAGQPARLDERAVHARAAPRSPGAPARGARLAPRLARRGARPRDPRRRRATAKCRARSRSRRWASSRSTARSPRSRSPPRCNALALRAKAQELPFGPGVFVFPACLVDARTASLRVLPLSELTGVSARGGEVVLAFGGTTFAFLPATPGEVEASVQAVEAARTELANAADDEARRLLDPLAAPSVASPLTPDVARTRTAPAWEKWRFRSARPPARRSASPSSSRATSGATRAASPGPRRRTTCPRTRSTSPAGTATPSSSRRSSCPAPPSARPSPRARSRPSTRSRTRTRARRSRARSTRRATPPSSPSSSAPRRPRRSRASSASARSTPRSARTRTSSPPSTRSMRAPSIAT